MRLTPVQTNFTAGELSPRLEGRVDIEKYFNSAKILENVIVHPHGGASRRPGTHHAAEVQDSSLSTRLYPFEFNTTQAYVLEFGNQYVRFFKDNGQITTSKSVTGATNANPVVVTATAHGYINGDTITFDSVGGMTELNGNTYTIANVAANTFELLGIDGTTFNVYTSGGNAVGAYSIATPYLTAELSDLVFTQSADVLTITHELHEPAELTRTGHTSWTHTDITFLDGPYLDENTSKVNKLAPSATTGAGITITASGGHTPFVSTDVGRFIRIKHSSTWGYAKVVGFTSTTVVTADVITDFGGTTAELIWRLGAWCETTGFPRTVTYFEDRLMFGGNTNQPQTIWGSKSGVYPEFTPGTTDDDPVTYTVASKKVNVILWMSPGKDLLVGTTGSEFRVGTTNGAPITPSNVNIKPHSSRGSNAVHAINLEGSVIFIQRSGKKIRELFYSFEKEGYTSRETSILSEHIPKPGIVDMSYQQEPDSIIWFVRSDGVLVSLTYEAEQQVFAFARQVLGGSGLVESVASIPISGGDQTWMIVKRTIDGGTKRYVEYFDSEAWDGADEFTDWNGLNTDSALTYDGASTTTISGLGHLEGETVKILADGAVHSDKTVASGSITLDVAATEVEVGLGYESTIQTHRPEIQGGAQGKKKQWHEVIVRLYESLGITINGDQVESRSSSDAMDSAPAIFSGDQRVSNLGVDRDGYITITQIQPLPFTVLLVTGILTING